MTLFLTSSPGGFPGRNAPRRACALNEKNHFVDHLKALWKPDMRVLFLASSRDDYAANDAQSGMLREALPLSGLPIACMDVCDGRNPDLDPKDYDFLILGGGHVPTQNAFFQEIGLKEALSGFDGILMGISAGTMNCAATVYAQPELPGEATDPDYRRFIPGLGLTDIMVLPHYQMLKNEVLDGLRIIEDITLPDSVGRAIHVLVDGSYILVNDQGATLWGEGYLARDGVLTQICEEGGSLAL